MSLIKVFDPFPRARGSTLEQFSEHWTTRHAAIAARLRQILHYVQTHRLENAPPALHDGFGPTWCDGSSETWYADVASLVQMTGEPACQELMQDEARFYGSRPAAVPDHHRTARARPQRIRPE